MTYFKTSITPCKKGGIQMNIELDLVKDFITNLNYSLDLQESF